MNIQIFGKSKCFDTKKAERYFKERGIRFQSINLSEKGMSKGEFNRVKQAVGGLESMIDKDCKGPRYSVSQVLVHRAPAIHSRTHSWYRP